MASVNKVILLGNLGHDPEVRYTADGDAVANLSIATSESWKDKATGEKREATEWHRVVLFGRTAEVASEFLRKGSSCYIEGKIKTRKWQDKDGRDRYTTEVHGDRLQLLGSRHADEGGGDGASAAAPAKPAASRPAPAKAQAGGGGSFDDFDDDIPF